MKDVSNAAKRAQVPAAGSQGTVEPAAEMVVSDLAVLRVLTDSLRLRVIEAFGRTRGVPRTVKEVARELGQSPTKLYYHVNLLEENGLLLVAESRLVSGIVEKRYVPAARQFRVDGGLLRTAELEAGADGRAALDEVVDGVLVSTATDLKRSIRAGLAGIGDDAPDGRKSVLSRSTLRLTPEQATQVVELLDSLVNRRDEDDAPDADSYGLTLAFYRQAIDKE